VLGTADGLAAEEADGVAQTAVVCVDMRRHHDVKDVKFDASARSSGGMGDSALLLDDTEAISIRIGEDDVVCSAS
jgi:hypothetical protein